MTISIEDAVEKMAQEKKATARVKTTSRRERWFANTSVADRMATIRENYYSRHYSL